MKNALHLLVNFVLLTSGFALGQSAKGLNVYVMDFTTRDRLKNDIATKFRYDFEESLIQYGNYNVLESRDYDRILSELDREKGIADVNGLSTASLDSLKAKQVQQLVFGEVFDDVESGQFNITITFQAFDRTKVLVKSILFPRGLVNDARSRKDAMANLVKELKSKTASTKRAESNGFIFELQECTRSERTASCKFLITNNDEDRLLRIYLLERAYGGRSTKAYDEFSNEVIASRIQLANKTVINDQAIESLIISGRPVEFIVNFDSFPSKATTIVRIDIMCWEGEHDVTFTVKFRNVPIEQ